MIGKLDESIWHQLPTTFDHVHTSDPRFYDRHWHAVYDPAGAGALQFTLGAYSNMNVLDAGLVVVHQGRQHNLRASRSLRPSFLEEVGPFRLEVLEPMRRHRIVITGEPGTIRGELEWLAVADAEEEPPHFSRHLGRIREGYTRYDQLGRCDGELDLGGRRVRIENWWATRDHSWGTRPGVGVEEPDNDPSIEMTEGAGGRRSHWPFSQFLFMHFFFSTEEFSGHVLSFFKDGHMVRLDGFIRDELDPRRAHQVATDMRLHVDLHPGTRRMRHLDMYLTLEGGRKVKFDITGLGPSIAMTGLGYSGGFTDGLGQGVWRGDNLVEHEVWDVSDPAIVRDRSGQDLQPLHRIQPVSAVSSGAITAAGTGSLTFVFEGELPEGVTHA